MIRLKQVFTAVALVVSLGLVVPSTLGGTASADPALNDHNNTFEATLNCQFGDDIVPTDVVTTSGAASFQVVGSSQVLVVVRIDQHREYTSLDPAYPDFEADVSFGAGYPQGKKHGQNAQTVPCYQTLIREFVGDGWPEGEVVGVPYHVVIDITWWVTVSGKPDGPVQVASADDGGKQNADRPQQGKHKNGGGKHRNKSKGKHRK